MTTRSTRRSPVAALLVIAAVAAGAFYFLTKNDNASARGDVAVQACDADASGGKPHASGTIVNHSSKASNYIIRLKFTDNPGNQVSQGVTAVKDVAPNANATWKLTGNRSATGPLLCKVTGVSRTHIPGQ